jgi:hypothetical protein
MGGRETSRKHYTPEQIIGKLREAEVALAQGETAGQVRVEVSPGMPLAKVTGSSRDRATAWKRVNLP